VARVSAFAIPGLDLWFNSSDHLPPHFHARRPGEWEIRVFFLLCTEERLEYTVKWKHVRRSIRRQDIEQLREAVVRNRVGLLEEWTAKVSVREVGD
jgi:hypothetical protein